MSAPHSRNHWLFIGAVFFISGALGLIYQVLWMKELRLLFGSTAQATATTLTAFFLGLAIGGWAGGRIAPRLRNPLRAYGVAEVGIPDFRREALPAAGHDAELWGEPLPVAGRTLPGYAVSVGNPHLVFRIEENVEDFPLEALNPWSRDARFPEGMNVHVFAQEGKGRLCMRSWERGTGPTLACGSGALATALLASLVHKVESPITVVPLSGMPLRVSFKQAGDRFTNLTLTGEARAIFDGQMRPEAWEYRMK